MDNGAALELDGEIGFKDEYSSYSLEDAVGNTRDPLETIGEEAEHTEEARAAEQNELPDCDLGAVPNPIAEPQEPGNVDVPKKKPKYPQNRYMVYACSLCEYVSNHKSHYDVHMRSHTGSKPFPCELCSYRAIELSALKMHIRTHTGEKPYTCSVCDFKCTQPGNLKRHMDMHNRVKPFFCELCEFRCAMLHHLKVHMRRHTGEKPYACQLCDFKAAHSSSLKGHMKMHIEGTQLTERQTTSKRMCIKPDDGVD